MFALQVERLQTAQLACRMSVAEPHLICESFSLGACAWPWQEPDVDLPIRAAVPAQVVRPESAPAGGGNQRISVPSSSPCRCAFSFKCRRRQNATSDNVPQLEHHEIGVKLTYRAAHMSRFAPLQSRERSTAHGYASVAVL